MTEPFDEYGDRLRRVLNAEAASVVPSPEGLENIRAKIDQRRERRLWYVRPWLRPLAAVSAAIALSVVAVPATAAFRNFVQTGHFSPYGDHDGGRHTVDGQHTYGQVPPGPQPTDPRVSPHPSTGLSTSPGRVASGDCPPATGEAAPTATPTPTPSASPADPEPSSGTPRVTCKPGTSPSSPSSHTSSTPSDPGSAPPPASEPPSGGSVPSAQSSP
jgi:hypothetical protein